jgi:nitrite reductase/ring-hydroxylating ferredoxin subunit
MDGICPHRDAPLAQGALHGRMVVCPWHAWEFDCTTGEHDYDPGVRLRCFNVKVEDGDIFVDHPNFP